MVGVAIIGYLILHAFWPLLIIPAGVVAGFVWRYKNSINYKLRFIILSGIGCYLIYIVVGIYAINSFRPLDDGRSLFLVGVINLFLSYLLLLFLYLLWPRTNNKNPSTPHKEGKTLY